MQERRTKTARKLWIKFEIRDVIGTFDPHGMKSLNILSGFPSPRYSEPAWGLMVSALC